MYRLSLGLLAISIFLRTSLSSAQDAKELFRSMQRSLGGQDKIAAVYDFEQCVRANAWDNDGKFHGVVYKRTRWIKPNTLRLDQVGSGNSYVVYFDGESGWEMLPDKGFVPLAGDELEFVKGYLHGIDLKSWLVGGDATNEFMSPASDVVAISTKGDSSHRTEIRLDPATLLPTEERLVSVKKGNVQVVNQTRQFVGWKAIQGIKFPRRIINFHGSQKVADINIQTIKLDGALKAKDLSERPSDLKPVMSGCGS